MTVFRKHSWNRYKELIGECSNLDCKHYTQLEAHHIIPIAAGGLDEFNNIIILCKTCHMNGNYHSDWVLHQDELHKWKGEVDSHLIYDDMHERWINNKYEYEKIKVEIGTIDIFDEDGNWIYRNPENIVSWKRVDMKAWKIKPETTFCYNCSKLIETYKFGEIFMCEKCIKSCIRAYFSTFKQIKSLTHNPVKTAAR